MSYLSYSQALELLRQKPESFRTPESLRNLLNNVDMQSSGDITIFYSGSYSIDSNHRISANEIVQAMYNNGDNIRIINSTPVAKLIDSEEFQKAVGRSFGFTDIDEFNIDYNDQSSRLNAAFFDAENGFWADASRRFAAETVGEVRTLTANARLRTQTR